MPQPPLDELEQPALLQLSAQLLERVHPPKLAPRQKGHVGRPGVEPVKDVCRVDDRRPPRALALVREELHQVRSAEDIEVDGYLVEEKDVKGLEQACEVGGGEREGGWEREKGAGEEREKER